MENKKLLYISYYFEYNSNPNGIQSERLLSELKNYYDITVVYRTRTKHSKQTLNDFSASKDFDLFPVYSKDLSIWDRRINRYIISICDFLSLDIIIWCFTFLMKFRRRDHNIIMISSNPFTVQIIGLLLKIRHKYTYISQFFDPLVDNYFSKLSRIALLIRKQYEYLIIKKSDFVFANNTMQYDRYIERYGRKLADKIHIIPFCTDVTLLDKINSNYRREINKNGKTILTHAGNLYGERNLDLLIVALNLLKKREVNLSDKLSVELIGGYEYKEFIKVKTNNLENVISFIPSLPFSEIYKYLQTSDGLILIDPDIEANIYFPSKLCEYLIYNKIIFGIIPHKSACRETLINTGNLIFHKEDGEFLANSISKLMHNADFYHDKTNPDYWEFFHPKRISKIILDLLENK